MSFVQLRIADDPEAIGGNTECPQEPLSIDAVVK
jgi:hypothetical protein